MDITYIPMARGWVYLAAVVHWASRRVLAHRVSITMDPAFCIEALQEAFARHGQPEIFNTDQGSQFTGCGLRQLQANYSGPAAGVSSIAQVFSISDPHRGVDDPCGFASSRAVGHPTLRG